MGEVYGRKGGERFLRRYFLRLACQQTAASFVEMSEKERGARAEGLLHRAILEEAAREGNEGVFCLWRESGLGRLVGFVSRVAV